jgi:hypothetical protein
VLSARNPLPPSDGGKMDFFRYRHKACNRETGIRICRTIGCPQHFRNAVVLEKLKMKACIPVLLSEPAADTHES